jgi:hypothetical protein
MAGSPRKTELSKTRQTSVLIFETYMFLLFLSLQYAYFVSYVLHRVVGFISRGNGNGIFNFVESIDFDQGQLVN